ncbi:unnamed protein product [Durusdinium trenchii]|uniref:RRM domain-containing protein n=1 Tax=Durusdinium trenchii TaxID=1381693 RepID=A0ABP0P280_9DINO
MADSEDLYGDLCKDLPKVPAALAPPAPPASSVAGGRESWEPKARARNLVWKPPTPAVATAVTGAGAAPAAAASGASSTGSPVKGPSGKESEVIDLDSLEELQVLNTRSFTSPPAPAHPAQASSSVVPSAGSAPEPAPVAAASEGANHPEFIPVPRPRAARNLVWTPTPPVADPPVAAMDGEQGATAKGEEREEILKVLNAPSVESMPEGLDIYGDLCEVPTRGASSEVKTPKFRPRARNLVWKAENPTRPAPKPNSKQSEVVVLDEDAGSVDLPPLQTQQQVAALQKALAEEEAETSKTSLGQAPAAPASPVSEEVEESSEDEALGLGEVLASKTGAQAPQWAAANAAAGPSHRAAPPPSMACACRPHDCFLLLAGVPGWLTDAELRKHCSQFGALRNLRVLCDSKGKSMSVLLVEFSKQEGVQQALRADGICRIRLLQGFGLQPRAMEVSAELHAALSEAASGEAAWPDGGACSEALRQRLMDVCGLEPVRKKRRTQDGPALTQEIKKLKGAPIGPGSLPAPKVVQDEDWTEKLKALKRSVHPASPPESPKAQDDAEHWAKTKLQALKRSVHPSAADAERPAPNDRGRGALCPAGASSQAPNGSGDWAQKLKKLKGAVNSHGR